MPRRGREKRGRTMCDERTARGRGGRYLAGIAAGWLAAAGLLADAAAQELKIGFMATFTGPGALLGEHLRDGFLLGVEEKGGELGGLETEVILADDQLKPDVAREEVQKLIARDQV